MNVLRSLAVATAVLLLAGCGGSNATNPPRSPGNGGPDTSFGPQPTRTPRPSLDVPAVFQVLEDFPSGEAFEVTAVTGTSSGLVAVGYAGYDGEDFYGRRQGLSWRSSDGMTWQQDAVDAALEFIEPTAVAALGNDVYLLGELTTCAELIEVDCEEPPEAGNIVLRSSNGGAWQRLSVGDDIRNADVAGMRVVGDQLAIFGEQDNQDGSAAIWLSTDGSSWTAQSDLAGIELVDTLAKRGDTTVVFGTTFDEEFDGTLAAATSTGGGFSSAALPDLPSGVITDVVADDQRFVAGGYVAPDINYASGMVLTSTDGQSWTQATATDNSFADGFPSNVFGVPGGGYVAIGFSVAGFDDTLYTGRVWRSSDGQQWHAVGTSESAYIDSSGAALGPAGIVLFVSKDDSYSYYGYGTPTGPIEAWLVPTAAFGE